MTSYFLRELTREEQQERARQREAKTPAELVAQVQQERARQREAETPAELVAQEREERARQREAKILAELDADVLPPTLNGRPRIELPPKIARRVLDDLGVGASYQSIVKKYRHIQRFSPRWLREAWEDGRLARMATTDPSEGGRGRLEN